MANSTPPASRRKIAGFGTAVLVGVFLVAGWWPFHAPRNGVSWLENGRGIRMSPPSILRSSAAVGRKHAVLRSFEILLRPDRANGAILAFQTKPAEHFFVAQSRSDLELQWSATGERYHYLYIPSVFQRGRDTIVTIVSDQFGAAVYVNGVLKTKSPGFRFSGSELAGRLVVGATPFSDYCWSGELRGLALYDRELSADEVRERFANRTIAGELDHAAGAGLLALYLFNERAGSVARDRGPFHDDLVIPQRFELLSPSFLHPFWKQYRFGWGFWEDVLVNIIGFLPFGFIFCAYLSDCRRTSAAIWVTVLSGFLVSVLIEVVQVYLPTRCSDSRDLLTNTLGTLLGAAVYRYRPARTLYEHSVHRVLERLCAAGWQFGATRRSSAVAEGASRVASD